MQPDRTRCRLVRWTTPAGIHAASVCGNRLRRNLSSTSIEPSKAYCSYAALIKGTKDTSLPAFLDAVKPVLADRMLDVGCGTGRFAVSMAPLVAQVVGVDLTSAMLNQARLAQAAAQIENIEWRQFDVNELPFADSDFTLVTSRAMLHHVASPASVIAEMRRVCAPGGRIVVNDLTPKPEKVAAFDAIEILRDPSHTHAMTHGELRAIGAESGLTEIAVREYLVTLPLEPVLQASFPEKGMLDRVRRLYRLDAECGADTLGLGARIENGEITVNYPMSMIAWVRAT
jgi:2-polyprenyl-3-methyl-5-hydroxy-6-metoxy-1,4-benzoquinol methylase